MGCVTQIGEQGWNVGRMAVLAAGWPVSVVGDDGRPAVRLVDADELQRRCGDRGGPARRGRIGGRRDDVARPDGLERRVDLEQVTSATRSSCREPPPSCSREEWNLSREPLDAYALESHRRAIAATDEGRFESELVPIELPEEPSRGGAATRTVFAVDEAARRETSLEALAALAPAFQADGVVTAGNSSQIVDGAAAVLITSEQALAAHGLEPRARFVSFGLAGVDPTRMLHGNPEAIRKALDRAGLTLDDIGVIEVNEAFAVVVLQTVADLGPRGADGRRQSERRRHLARPSARCDRRADHRDAASGARTARRALRRRLDVRRLRHGDRGG